jgi:ERCC4-related helicase
LSKYAPGMRVLIRDEEWLVRKVDNNSYGGNTVSVIGLSRLVKDIDSIFMDNLDKIEIINPADTKLVPDNSPFFVKSKLYIESLLRRKAPTGDGLYIGHRAAMDTVPYQLEPALLALSKSRQRILIADGVGLGKTMEAGILMSELMIREKGRRILVITVKSMMTQFQKEMWNRFSIPLVRLDSYGIARIRGKIPSNHNPFYYYDKVIISMDTLKRDIEYRTYLESAYWDIIVIDEAHNVAERGKFAAQRSRLAKLLADRSDALIMLSATPHDGSKKSFASLMNMLDATAIANPEDYTKDDIEGLFIRRFKKDIKDQGEGAFKKRIIHIVRTEATAKEEVVFDFFANMQLKSLDGDRKGAQLFKTVLEKSLFSSPAACISTIKNRLNRLKEKNLPSIINDANQLNQLLTLLSIVTPRDISRYNKLLNLLKSSEYGWDKSNSKDRIIIFTERIETMKFLKMHIPADIDISEDAVCSMDGSMSDTEQQRIVDDFGRDEAKVRVLIASDVASEGINLHYLSHRIVHFDIPWSLMAFQQRNGRIDRYGQTKTPDIRYLVTVSQNKEIHGDIRILEILIEKEEQAYKNIGDPAVLMNVFNEEDEENITAKAIESNTNPDTFSKMLEKGNMDILSLMLEQISKPSIKNPVEYTHNLPCLYNDLEYLKDALEYFTQKERIKFEIMTESQGARIEMTGELKERLEGQIPYEAIPSDEVLWLCTDKTRIETEIIRARQEKIEENTWPRVQYLWPMHPIVQWIIDKSGILFGRQETPVILLENVLKKDEVIFLASGMIPNRRSQSMINEWLGLHYIDGKIVGRLPLSEVLSKTGLGRDRHPNSGKVTTEECNRLLKYIPSAIDEMKSLMQKEHAEFEKLSSPKLNESLNRLEILKLKHFAVLSLFDNNQSASGQRYKDEKRRTIDKLFDNFFKWMEDTMCLEKDALIQIVAVFTGGTSNGN